MVRPSFKSVVMKLTRCTVLEAIGVFRNCWSRLITLIRPINKAWNFYYYYTFLLIFLESLCVCMCVCVCVCVSV